MLRGTCPMDMDTPTNEALGGIVGASPAMRRVFEQVRRVAASSTPVLIGGEAGTGKELVARTLHDLSLRHDAPFVPVACEGMAPVALENELFGPNGAMTRAGGGSLFLDEIGEMPLALQARLQQALEGASAPRLIAASRRDLEAKRRAGQFRDDLLMRLNVFPIQLPPLRERLGDVERLAQHFVATLNEREGGHKLLSKRSLDALRSYGWPGNVRELRNAVQRAYILADRHIEITPAMLAARGRLRREQGNTLSFGVGTPLADAQREILLATLEHFGGDKRRTARVLGISLKTLYNRLELYGDTVHVRRRRAAA